MSFILLYSHCFENVKNVDFTSTHCTATENLVQYSKTQPSIFKAAQLTPVKDLKLLIRDYAVRASHLLNMESERTRSRETSTEFRSSGKNDADFDLSCGIMKSCSRLHSMP